MRKLILGEWLSLDAFAADKNGTTKFFESREYGGVSDEHMLKFMEDVDTIIIGRKTYELFADFWPKATTSEELMADCINETHKIVFSSSLDSAPWGKWDPATVNRGDAVEEVKRLKAQSGKDMVLWGSISLAQSLIEADLIDEFQIRVVPVLLGEGRPMFSKSREIPLKLVETRAYESGVVYSRYVPKQIVIAG